MREITGAAAVQGSDEWKELRKNLRTASTAFTACRGSHNEKVKLARQSLGLEEFTDGMPQKVKDIIQRGNTFEPEARAAAGVHFGEFFEPKVFVSGNYLASLDGQAASGRIIEIKVPASTESDLWKAALRGEIPEKYDYQMTQQRAVSGSSSDAWLWVYSPEEKRGIAVQHHYSPALWDEIRHGYDQYWSEYRNDDCGTKTDDEWIQVASRLHEIRNITGPLIAEEKRLKETVLRLAGNKAASGYGIQVIESVKKDTFDYAQYCADNVPEALLEKYRKKGQTVLSVRID